MEFDGALVATALGARTAQMRRPSRPPGAPESHAKEISPRDDVFEPSFLAAYTSAIIFRAISGR